MKYSRLKSSHESWNESSIYIPPATTNSAYSNTAIDTPKLPEIRVDSTASSRVQSIFRSFIYQKWYRKQKVISKKTPQGHPYQVGDKVFSARLKRQQENREDVIFKSTPVKTRCPFLKIWQ